jgi:competence protein ComEC
LGIECEFLGDAVVAWSGLPAFAIALWPRARWPRARLIAFVTFALGIADAALLGHPPESASDPHFHRFAATVIDERAAADGALSLTVRLADGKLATMETRDAPVLVGVRLWVRAKRTVFDDARNPGEPSERELQSERGVGWRLAAAKILARGPPDESDVSLWIPRSRAWASQRLHATLDEPGATILAGAMWGERSALPPDLRADFQDTGTVHILVTAGLHLGVVAALCLGLLRALGCGRVSSSLATIAIVWLYAAFSGDHLPSVRAATMLSFALTAHAAGREALSWNALGAAAIAIAGVDPASVRSLSFALSFSCVAAIVAFAKPLAHALEGRGVPGVLSELVAVSVAAQLGTWPLTAAAFLVIAPYALIANIAVVPVVGVVMLAGFAALLIAPVPFAATIASNVATSLLDWIVACVRLVSALPGAHVIATPPPQWTIVVYDLALAAANIAIARHRYVATSFVLVAAAGALCVWPPRGSAHDLVITAIDVGQADAILIRTPAGHAYLVDAGGRLERGSEGGSQAEAVGERIVVPFLIRSGIHHLDAILISHPHGDHVGGMPPILRALGADIFADSGQAYPGHAYHDALDVVAQQRVPIVYPRGGAVWTTDDGVTFRFYAPTVPLLTKTRNDINNNSLVFRLEYGHFRMLFTGDAGADAEARILASGADLRADVLKVGHHGSAYSSTPEFVRAVSPQFAVISVGRDNLFGHPAASTIETLERAGARVYRTDRDGAVTIRSSGESLQVRPFLTRGATGPPILAGARATPRRAALLEDRRPARGRRCARGSRSRVRSRPL